MQRILITILSSILMAALVVSALTVAALAGTLRVQSGQWRVPHKTDLRTFVEDALVRRAPEPSRVVYMERDAMQVLGGRDDAKAQQSSLIAAGTMTRVPKYKATNKTWQRLVSCVEDKFAAYDITVTDQRPAEGDYITVKVGGTPADIGKAGQKIGGIAPFNGLAIPNSIVFVFDQRGRFRTRNNCDTAAHEIGHVYGLDHTYECSDLMSYQRGCGTKSFVDKPMECGEHETRECEGDPLQNSAAQLTALLGAQRTS